MTDHSFPPSVDELPPEGFDHNGPKRKVSITYEPILTSPRIGSTLLYSQDAEEAVLGSVLINAECYDEVTPLLTDSRFFYLDKNKWVWRAFQWLRENNKPFDLLTVSERLQDTNHLDEIGGVVYLTKLINAVPTTLHVYAYAQLVWRDYHRRDLLETASYIGTQAYTPTIDPIEFRGEAAGRLLNGVTVPGKGARPLSEFVSKVYDEIEERLENPRDIWGLDTGFYDLNYITGGLQKREVFKVVGAPGVGKTQFVFQLAAQLAGIRFDGSTASIQHAGAFYELEMDGSQLVRRALSALTSIPVRGLRTGRINDEKIPAISAGASKLIEANFFLDDATFHTTATLRADIMRLQREHDIEWVVVDMQNHLLDKAGTKDLEREKYISRELVRLAKDLDIAVIAVAKLNKNGLNAYGGSPDLGDVYGGIEEVYDAANVMFITEHIPARGQQADPNLVTNTFKKLREAEKNVSFNLRRIAKGVTFFANVMEPKL